MSLRLKILNTFLRAAVKPKLRRLKNPHKARRDLEHGARWFFRRAPLTTTLKITLADGLRALSIRNNSLTSASPKQPIILYLHGGGYVAGSPRSHAKMLGRLSLLTGLEVIAPWYKLAPEHPFPAGFNDAKDSFNALVSKGYAPNDIILGGDSAGGGMALALMADLATKGQKPRALFAFSPLTDMRFHGASFTENETNDPLLPAAQKDLIRTMYLDGHPPEDPRVSPLLAEFQTTPPPVFLQFSESEILRDDSLRMAAHLRAAGGIVTLDPWPDTPHVWVLFDGWLPEAREALQRTADFVKTVAQPDDRQA